MIDAPSVATRHAAPRTHPDQPVLHGLDPLHGDAVALLAAHRHLTSDLCPTALPHRIVEAARALTGAGFGLLRTPDGVTHRIDDRADGDGGTDTDSDTDSATVLHRILEAAADESDLARAVRLDAAGFLAAVLHVRDRPHAELFVRRSDGAARFDQADAARLEAFAAAAGSVLETSLVYRESLRTRDWLHASGEITRALLAEDDDELLVAAVNRLIAVADADAASLLLPAGDGGLAVVLSSGLGCDDIRGTVIRPATSPLCRSLVAGRSVLASDLLTFTSAAFDNQPGFGPLLGVPLIDARGVRGAITLLRSSAGAPFKHSDLDLVGSYADQLTVALDLADVRVRAGRITALEERHRIAQDLHDNVMQRLFATGVGLQSLHATVATLSTDAAGRLSRHVADLDETIDQIRERVFDLRRAGVDPSGRACGVAAETGYVT